jgi:hypothetical protein
MPKTQIPTFELTESEVLSAPTASRLAYSVEYISKLQNVRLRTAKTETSTSTQSAGTNSPRQKKSSIRRKDCQKKVRKILRLTQPKSIALGKTGVFAEAHSLHRQRVCRSHGGKARRCNTWRNPFAGRILCPKIRGRPANPTAMTANVAVCGPMSAAMPSSRGARSSLV